MHIDRTTTLTLDEIQRLTGPLQRFERRRTIPALVLLGAVALLAFLAFPPMPAFVALLCFFFMAGLSFTIMRTARRAVATTEKFVGDFHMRLTPEGLAAEGSGNTVHLPWDRVQHATKANAGWLFVGAKGTVAVPVPARLLTEEQTGQVHQLLSSWPLRRYRRTPW